MNRNNLLFAGILILSVLLISYFAYQSGDVRALILNNEDREFTEPIDIVWSGKIISTMAGGSCIGLSGNFDKYSFASACLSEGNLIDMWKFEGMVTISGKWLGITCAYKNTIFGECVPEVSIESIEK